MQHKSLTFNGIRKPWLYLLEGRNKSPFAPIQNNLLYVPGMPGAHITSSETGVLYITQPIGFIVENEEHALQILDELKSWLITDEPVELQFEDEPGRTYFAKLEGTIEDFQKFVNQRKGVVTFICPDPYSYGPELTAQFQSDVLAIKNEGTVEANPIFELEVLQPVTFAMIQNQLNEYMMIGRPVTVDDIPTEKYPRVLQESGASLTGWSHMTSGYVVNDSMFSGIAGGQMGTSGHSFIANSFGSNPNGWTGPMIRRSFSQALQDFKATIDISMFNRLGGVGKVIAFFLDANDNIVASMGIYDATNGYANNKVAFRLGGRKTIVDMAGDDNSKAYNNGRMWLQLTREGQQFKAFSYRKHEDGTLHARNTESYPDKRNEFQAPIHQVMLYIAKAKEYNPFEMHMNGLSVFGINDLNAMQVPYIAQHGDIITFDHSSADILINGEPFMIEKDFGASFFKFQKGDNQLLVHPSNAFNTSIRYRNRYR